MFGIFAVGGGLGLVLFNAPKPVSTAQNDAPNGLSVLMDFLSGDASSPFAPAAPEGALVAYLPLPPVGWTREAYQTEQGEALTGAEYQNSAVIISTTNSLLAGFDRASRDPNSAAVTYRKDEEVVAISIASRTERDMNSLQGGIMTAIAGNMNATLGFGERPSGFGNVHGVNFAFGPTSSRVMATGVEVPINYRSLSASMGGQMSISVMTNASDAAIAEIVGAIDIVGLNNTLVTPDLTVTPGTGLITSQREDLSAIPPAPTLAYRAFQKLRSDVSDLSEDDVRLLQDMASGKNQGWVDIFETDGLNHNVSPALAEILGEKPELAPIDQVRFEAKAMLGNPAVLADYEIDLVRDLASGRFQTREDAQRQLSQTRLYGPPVLRLITKLPAAATQEVAGPGVADEAIAASTAPAREIIVRRGIAVQQGDVVGGDCVIELGVRRCTMEEADQ